MHEKKAGVVGMEKCSQQPLKLVAANLEVIFSKNAKRPKHSAEREIRNHSVVFAALESRKREKEGRASAIPFLSVSYILFSISNTSLKGIFEAKISF